MCHYGPGIQVAIGEGYKEIDLYLSNKLISLVNSFISLGDTHSYVLFDSYPVLVKVCGTDFYLYEML